MWVHPSARIQRTQSRTSYFSRTPNVTSSPPLRPWPRLSGSKTSYPLARNKDANPADPILVSPIPCRMTTHLPLCLVGGLTNQPSKAVPSLAVRRMVRQSAPGYSVTGAEPPDGRLVARKLPSQNAADATVITTSEETTAPSTRSTNHRRADILALRLSKRQCSLASAVQATKEGVCVQ